MNYSMLSKFAVAVACMLAINAHADDSLPITISGFGTGALTMSNTNDGLFNRVNQVGGAGKSARTGVDSNLGLQANAYISDNISVTLQGLVRKNGPSDQYSGELAWAFAKFKANDDFSFRFGRIGLPIYMISDVRNVGYANTLLRAPNEVYRQVAADNIDGADLLYQHSFNDINVTAQFTYGRTRFHASPGYDIEFKPVVSSQLVVENGPLTYRVSHSQATVNLYDNIGANTLIATLQSVGLSGISNQIPIRDFKGTFDSAGVSLDFNGFVAQAEYARRKTETRLVPDTSSWYVMAGYRYEKFVPYVMHGDVKQNSIRNFGGLPATGPLAGLTAAANGAIQEGLQSTTAIGLRWDFYKSAAFKVQIDHITPREGTGYFVSPKPSLNFSSVNVYAAGIDFVF